MLVCVLHIMYVYVSAQQVTKVGYSTTQYIYLVHLHRFFYTIGGKLKINFFFSMGPFSVLVFVNSFMFGLPHKR